jgi:hypothetical protein
MGIFADTFDLIAGLPAIVGLILTAAVIFLTSDWRLSLTSLLVQYVLVGLTLTRFVQAELAVVKILVGVLIVSMLFLSARHVRDDDDAQETSADDMQFLGMHVGWRAGPLGLPLRILTLIMVFVAAIHFFDDYRTLLPVLDAGSAAVSADIAFVSMWLAAMGLMGLVISGDPVRVAPAVLTTLTAFELVYALLEPDLADVGFVAALMLMAALALAYLITVRGLRERRAREASRAEVLPAAMPVAIARDEEGGQG